MYCLVVLDRKFNDWIKNNRKPAMFVRWGGKIIFLYGQTVWLHVEGRKEPERREAIQLKCYCAVTTEKNTHIFGLGGGEGNGEKSKISTNVQGILK